MNELIWFSIPGAVGLYALHLMFPESTCGNEVLVVVSAPILGFVLHQTYRTFFEFFRGWETDRRSVLALIRKAYAIKACDKHTPFLVWETTFYSNDIPDSFRNHNRNSWHYVMSFWAVAFTCALSGLACAFLAYWRAPDLPILQSLPKRQIVSFALLFVLFWGKGQLTYSSLGRQECAAFRRYRERRSTVRTRRCSSQMIPVERLIR